MTFTTKIKEEIVATTPDLIDARITLLSYIKFVSTNENDRIHILIENASVARYIFKLIKMSHNCHHKKVKQKKYFIYIFTTILKNKAKPNKYNKN